MEGNPYESGNDLGSSGPSQRERDLRLWAMLLHLSAILGWTGLPLMGLVVPIVIWQVKKDDLPEIDIHGRNVANWLITSLIYFGICFVACFVFIGFPMMVLLIVAAIAFPLIGGLKANNGVVWEYPLTFRFF